MDQDENEELKEKKDPADLSVTVTLRPFPFANRPIRRRIKEIEGKEVDFHKQNGDEIKASEFGNHEIRSNEVNNFGVESNVPSEIVCLKTLSDCELDTPKVQSDYSAQSSHDPQMSEPVIETKNDYSRKRRFFAGIRNFFSRHVEVESSSSYSSGNRDSDISSLDSEDFDTDFDTETENETDFDTETEPEKAEPETEEDSCTERTDFSKTQFPETTKFLKTDPPETNFPKPLPETFPDKEPSDTDSDSSCSSVSSDSDSVCSQKTLWRALALSEPSQDEELECIVFAQQTLPRFKRLNQISISLYAVCKQKPVGVGEPTVRFHRDIETLIENGVRQKSRGKKTVPILKRRFYPEPPFFHFKSFDFSNSDATAEHMDLASVICTKRAQSATLSGIFALDDMYPSLHSYRQLFARIRGSVVEKNTIQVLQYLNYLGDVRKTIVAALHFLAGVGNQYLVMVDAFRATEVSFFVSGGFCRKAQTQVMAILDHLMSVHEILHETQEAITELRAGAQENCRFLAEACIFTLRAEHQLVEAYRKLVSHIDCDEKVVDRFCGVHDLERDMVYLRLVDSHDLTAVLKNTVDELQAAHDGVVMAKSEVERKVKKVLSRLVDESCW